MEKRTGGKQFMKRKVRQLAGCLFVMALMIGVVLTKGITATAASAGNVNVASRNALVSTGNAYSAYLVGPNDTDFFDTMDKCIKFGGYDWYVIQDNSTSQTLGTLTLFMVNALCISEFNTNEDHGNKYSTSTVRVKLQNYLNSDKNLWAVSDAIKPITVVTYTDGTDSEVFDTTSGGDKLWLLSLSEALGLGKGVLECRYDINEEYIYNWWLRSPNGTNGGTIIRVTSNGELINASNAITGNFVYQALGVRPALKLDLSAVTFDSGTRTFSLKSTERKVRLSGGSNASVSGSTEQRIATGAMSTVTYTANNGFYFEPFTDIVSDGITVKRISDRQVMVSGTPTANTMITVPDARSTTLTVTFNANGGTGTMSDVHVQLYSTYKLPACTFTPPAGKEFNGWDKGAVGTTITVNADTTIVARWKKKKTASTQGAFSDYVPENTDLAPDLLEKRVKFNDIWWYIIADNSTAKRSGTLTLFSVDPIDSYQFGQFGEVFYIDSYLSTYMLVGLLPVRFKNVYDAIADTKSYGGFSIQKGKYLDILSTEEAKNLPCGEKIRKCNKADGAEGNYWWLRTQGTGSSGAAYVNGNTGEVIASGAGGTNTMIFGIRPVLQLDLSKVYFSTKTNTFALEPFTYNVAITGGANAARSGGAAPQTVADGNAMNTVTYTANKGFHFEQFTTITNNGVSVSRNGDTVVTVSGTPTADVSITVPNAVVISTTTPEPGTDDSNPSQTTGSEDNGSSNTEQAQYNQDSDQTDTAEVQPVETIDKTQKGTTLSKPKAGKKSVTLSWKKQTAKGIKGYEIQYSTDKSFSKDTTKTKTINKSKTTKLKIKGLKSKTKYFIRIRTFSKKNGEKVYSRWSNVKNVKVK